MDRASSINTGGTGGAISLLGLSVFLLLACAAEPAIRPGAGAWSSTWSFRLEACEAVLLGSMRSVATGQADPSLTRLATTPGASGGMVVIARDGGVERAELGRAVRGESDLPPPVVRA